MGKSTFKIISKKDNRVLASIKGRKNSDEVQEFISAFKRDYTEINWLQGLPDDVHICELIEDCGYDYAIVNDAINNNDLKRLDYVEVDPNYAQIVWAGTFEIPFYSTKTGVVYIPKEKAEVIEKIITSEYKPLVIKGTDYPYWYDVEGKLLPAEEPNWFLYLYEKFRVISRNQLEEYKAKKTKKSND
jgi:hypothetical protein